MQELEDEFQHPLVDATAFVGPKLLLERFERHDGLRHGAMAAGAADEGAPGVRGEEGPQAFYGAYFRDFDGNKLCGFRIGPK